MAALIHLPRSIRTGYVAWHTVVDDVPVPAFQAYLARELEPLALAPLDAPPCLPSGGMLDCAGPAVGLALWWGR